LFKNPCKVKQYDACRIKSNQVYLLSAFNSPLTQNQSNIYINFMKKTTVLLFLLFTVTEGFSQLLRGQAAMSVHPNATEVRMDDTGIPAYIRFSDGSIRSTASSFDALRAALSMNTDDVFTEIKSETDETGMQHRRLQQHYKGIPVETGEYLIHEKKGATTAVNGKYYANLNINIAPSLTEKQALDISLQTINATKYIWQDSAEEAEAFHLTEGKKTTWYPKGELVILPSLGYSKEQTTALCWKFEIRSLEPAGRYFIYINASTGKVMHNENRLCGVAVTGSGNTFYNGTRSFTTDSIGPGSYRLQDNTRASGVRTYNMLNGTSYAAAVDFTDTDNIWTSTTNQDHAALDAHWGAQQTYDYFLTVHNRNSYNNTGSPLLSYVHYSASYNNAFWDGTRMTYGDGDGSVFSPLTELDVCGHELTHGVTQNSSGLIYSYESGAMNEGFSDIFGKAIDFYVNPGTADWRIGGKCYTPGTAGDALRFMNNPNAAGDPDTYLGTNWYAGAGDNGGVHTNSGVLNYWFYLLVNGGSGTNDVGFNFNVAGLGIVKARAIAYRTNNVYLTSSSKYADAGFYSLKAASDLYGNCSPEAISVKNAWDAVGVFGLQLNAAATAAVSGGSCLGNNIQLSASGGVTFAWTGPNGFNSPLQNPVITNAAANNAGTYICTVTDVSGCTGTPSVNVILNTPPTVNAGTDVATCNGALVNLNASGSVSGGGNSGVNTTPLSIPDSPAPAVFSNIIIGGATNASAVTSVIIDSLIHTWDGDLDIRLVAPNGSEIVLSNNNGGSGDNYIGTTFITGAGTAITAGVAPFTGSFTPEQPFSNLTGTANGTWRLKIQDVGGADIGTLYKWRLTLAPNVISSYSWSPATGLSNPAVANPTATVTGNVNYTVTVTDAQGCTASDNISISASQFQFLSNITSASCGVSNGAINLTVSNGNAPYTYNWSNGASTEDISNVAAGVYTVTVTDASSCSGTSTFTVPTAGGGSPSTPGGITGASAVCAPQNSVTYTVASVAGATGYNWTLPANTTGSSSTNSITVNYGAGFTGGNICVRATNACGTSDISCKPVTWINAAPALPAAISGPTVACANTTQTYSVAPVTNATIYNWTIPANTSIISGAGTNSIVLSFNGSWVSGALRVNAGNCIANSSNRSISLRGIPAQPSTITGNRFGLCPGTTHPYSVTLVAGVNYVWTAPAGSVITGQGSNSVNIKFPTPFASGTVSVLAQNVCGNSTLRTITVRSVPSSPGTISGPLNNNCAKTNITYSVPVSTTGATGYIWTVPAFINIVSGQNTNSIVVNFTGSGTGNITVLATNSCGNSAVRTLSNVTTMPARPASISGDNTVCQNQLGVPYSVTSQSGVSYNWTLPSGTSVASGQNTSSITANWATTAGNVSVVASNTCGNAQSRTLAVTFNCRVAETKNTLIQLFPNPASQNVTLTVENTIAGNATYEICDLLGNIVSKENISEENTLINVADYAKGIYMLKVIDNDGIQNAMRLIIQ
jgi:Zn-dependent metalloprotease/subtilisin-like proprotein convertase family protein